MRAAIVKQPSWGLTASPTVNCSKLRGGSGEQANHGMDFQKYETLGRRIDAAWHRAHRDEKQFPAIASEALAAFQPEAFDLQEVGRFLFTTSIPQQPATRFSNLPVTMYRGDGFHLELLIWTQATTSIHQHAFSGAFRLVEGSSLHSDYCFLEQQRINSHVLLGDIRMEDMRLLKRGDVLPIVSGRDGLVHSLFHLDEPSATLVARTSTDLDSGPQYELIKPRFAVDPFWAHADERMAMVDRWWRTAMDVGGAQRVEALLDQIGNWDLARILAFVLYHPDLFVGSVMPHQVLEKLRDFHVDLIGALTEGIQTEQRKNSLVVTRKLIKDPDLRFFIALLMNAQSRTQVLEMIRARQASIDAEMQCTDWLLRIGDPARLGLSLRERSPLLLRLGMAVSAAGTAAPHLLEAIVRGQSSEQALATLSAEDSAQQRALAQADRAIRGTPELAALIRSSV